MKADSNLKSGSGYTPLINAVLSRNLEIVLLLVDSGSARVNLKSNQGLTAMDYALQNRYTEISEKLKLKGAIA